MRRSPPVGKQRATRRPTVPTRETSRTQAANFLKKAEGHLSQALEAAAAGRWDTAVLLAVHAGISASDAGCVAHHGLRSISQTHMDQVRLIRQLFPGDDEAGKASDHLAALLDRKNTVEYEGRLCQARDADELPRCREGDSRVTPTSRKGRIATSLNRQPPARRLAADGRAPGAAARTRPAGLGCCQCQTLEIGSAYRFAPKGTAWEPR